MIAFNKLYLCRDEVHTQDPTYRYRVEKPQFQARKKKGANMTYFINSKNVAAGMEFDHALLIKIMGAELSCQSSVDAEMQCGAFKGEFDATALNRLICSIVQKYLLCPRCEYPEISFSKSRSTIHTNCKACGHVAPLRPEHQESKVGKAIANSL